MEPLVLEEGQPCSDCTAGGGEVAPSRVFGLSRRQKEGWALLLPGLHSPLFLILRILVPLMPSQDLFLLWRKMHNCVPQVSGCLLLSRAAGSGGSGITGCWTTTPCPSGTFGGDSLGTSTPPTRGKTDDLPSLKVRGCSRGQEGKAELWPGLARKMGRGFFS